MKRAEVIRRCTPVETIAYLINVKGTSLTNRGFKHPYVRQGLLENTIYVVEQIQSGECVARSDHELREYCKQYIKSKNRYLTSKYPAAYAQDLAEVVQMFTFLTSPFAGAGDAYQEAVVEIIEELKNRV